jgi:hypothetical protein
MTSLREKYAKIWEYHLSNNTEHPDGPDAFSLPSVAARALVTRPVSHNLVDSGLERNYSL